MPISFISPGLKFDSRDVRSRFFKYQSFILIFTFISYTAYHMSRKPISVVKSVLHQNCSAKAAKKHWHLTLKNASYCSWKPFDQSNYAELLGSLEYAYLFAYAIGMLISGHLAERINLRHYLGIGMILSGLTTVLFGAGYYWSVHNITYYVTVQIIGGFVQATGWPSVVACMGNWFGKGRRGLIMGLWNSHTSAGNILGSVLAGLFVNTAWGLSFLVPGLAITLVGFVCLATLVPHPNEIGLPSPYECSLEIEIQPRKLEEKEEASLLEEKAASADEEAKVFVTGDAGGKQAIGFLGALRIPGVIEFSLCLFFAKLVSYTFLYWLPNYIKHSNGLDPERSAFLSTLFDIGGIFGGVLAGLLSDIGGLRATTCAGMLLMAAPCLLLYQQYGGVSLFASVVLLFVTGGLVNGPYALITTAVSADLGTSSAVGGNAKALATVTAIIDGTGSMGAAFGPLLTGLIVKGGWSRVFHMLIIADLCALFICLLVCLRTEWNNWQRVTPLVNWWAAWIRCVKMAASRAQCCSLRFAVAVCVTAALCLVATARL